MTEKKFEEKKMDMKYPAKFIEELKCLLKSREVLIYLQNEDEKRLCKFLGEFDEYSKYNIILWDCSNGFFNYNKKSYPNLLNIDNSQQPIEALEYIRFKNEDYLRDIKKAKEQKNVYVLLDGYAFFNDPVFVRKLKNMIHYGGVTSIIITGSESFSCPALNNYVIKTEIPLSIDLERREVIGRAIKQMKIALPDFKEPTGNEVEEILDITKYLTLYQMEQVLSHTLCKCKKIDLIILKGRCYKII